MQEISVLSKHQLKPLTSIYYATRQMYRTNVYACLTVRKFSTLFHHNLGQRNFIAAVK